MDKKEIVNNKEGKPFEYYCEQYRALDPERAAARCKAEYYAGEGEFELTMLKNRYRVSFPEYATSCIEQNYPTNQFAGLGKGYILLIRYLIEGKSVPALGRFYTYKEMPWGEVYNRQFTGRCIDRMAFTYGKRIGDFCRIMEAFGAKKIENGDAGYEIEFMDGFFLRMMLWEADEEFPPSAQILFSDNFPEAFAPEDLVVVCDVVLNAMKEIEASLRAKN